MASQKDTFEAHSFRANTFASGTWRGTGVAPTVYPTLEYTIDQQRLHYALTGQPRLGYLMDTMRLLYSTTDNSLGYVPEDSRLHYSGAD